MVYWSEIDFNFAGDVSRQPGGLQAGVDTALPLPQWARAGIYHEINDRFALLGSVGWEDWSHLENVNLSFASVSAALPRNWKDTYHFAGGIHYRLSTPWLLQFGIAYDTSPVDAEDRTADMPIDRQIRYTIGTQYEKSEKLTIGCALEYLDLGDAEINNSNPINGLKGTYKNNDLLAFVINFNQKNSSMLCIWVNKTKNHFDTSQLCCGVVHLEVLDRLQGRMPKAIPIKTLTQITN